MTTDPDRWRRIDALFEAVADLAPEARAARLDQEPDAEVRREVEALLAAEADATGFFRSLADEIAPHDGLRAGDRVGPYVLAERVGEGGMGTVWRAERDDGTFAQTVALKTLRAGDARRFAAERQILARLEHPAIARILDGGLTPDGRPYFAMEFVDGEPITAYADRHGLSVDERLALFAQVCEAVQFAHARLVVHRDLKPSNVFVASPREGGESQLSVAGKSAGRSATGPSPLAPLPSVKLLDFGIAKALDGDGTLTQTAAPLTPAYAAPEQVRGEEVTTATDVYALGVLLYELLTGTRPYHLDTRARAAMERAILETEPTRPSEAVTQETADAPRLSRAKRLRGDLDHICLAALRKEPEARYPSAEALASDVRRHLSGEPVEARGPSATYRLRRFARRHRGGVLATAMVALLLVAWAATATVQTQRVADERDRAEALNRVLVDLFEGVDPTTGGDRDLTVSQFLTSATDRLRFDLADRPALRAELLSVIASSHLGLGDATAADSGAALAAEAASVLPPGHSARTLARGWHAWTRTYHGDYETSERIYREVLREATEADRPDVQNDFAIVLGEMGEADEARDLFQRAIATLRTREGDDARRSLASALDNLSSSYADEWTSEGYDRAWLLQQEAIELKTTIYGADHPQTAEALSELAGLAADRDALTTADSLFARSAEILETAYGPEHPTLATVLNNWALRLANAELPDRAEPLYRRALAIRETVYGEEHQATAGTLQNLAVLLSATPRAPDALPLLDRAEAIYRAVMPEGHYLTAFPIASRASVHRKRGDNTAAVRDGQEAASILESSLGLEHTVTQRVRGEVGVSLARLGRTTEAEPLLRAALEADLTDEGRADIEAALREIDG
ncbi:MAG: serine/threonine-protein kinase [Bacteroidota bacterium]